MQNPLQSTATATAANGNSIKAWLHCVWFVELIGGICPDWSDPP